MILDSCDKLRAIQRSLETVIIPAIPEEAGQAREQAQFAAMHCRAMLAQVDWEYAMEIAEAQHFADLCRTLGAAANEPLLARAEGFGAGPPSSHGAVRDVVRDLRERADELLSAALESGDGGRANAATRAVLAASRGHEVRMRAWVQDASYDTCDVPPVTIAESLDPAHLDHSLA